MCDFQTSDKQHKKYYWQIFPQLFLAPQVVMPEHTTITHRIIQGAAHALKSVGIIRKTIHHRESLLM